MLLTTFREKPQPRELDLPAAGPVWAECFQEAGAGTNPIREERVAILLSPWCGHKLTDGGQ